MADRCIETRFKSFGGVLAKTRDFVVKYRMSPKAKTWLKTRFRKRLAGYVVTRLVLIMIYV